MGYEKQKPPVLSRQWICRWKAIPVRMAALCRQRVTPEASDYQKEAEESLLVSEQISKADLKHTP